MRRAPFSPLRSSQRRQRGLVLIVALIALVVMTLAAVSMLRSVDISTQISGNLGFRQTGTQSADAGIEAGRNWLMTMTNLVNLETDLAPNYYATWNGGAKTGTSFDPTNTTDFDWEGNSALVNADDNSGNEVRYVIHRMCDNTGNPTTANCVTAALVSTANGIKGDSQQTGDSYSHAAMCTPGNGNNCTQSAPAPMYRITARAKGPHNTYSYTQAMIY